MLAERPGANGWRSSVACVCREAAAGAREGLLAPLKMARAFHERWGIKGILGALGLTAMVSTSSFVLTGDIPRGALLAVLSLPVGGVISRLERLAKGED